MAKRMIVAIAVILGVLTFGVHPAGATELNSTYTVQQGDTLWNIAVSHGISSWYDLYLVNQDRIADPQSLVVGTVLVVPSADTISINLPDAPLPVTPPVVVPGAGDGSIEGIITDAALRYGQSPSEMKAVAYCESRYDSSVVNPLSGASGLFQFLPSTWASTPYASENIFNAYANANAAAWMFSVGRRGEWVC